MTTVDGEMRVNRNDLAPFKRDMDIEDISMFDLTVSRHSLYEVKMVVFVDDNGDKKLLKHWIGEPRVIYSNSINKKNVKRFLNNLE